MIAHTFEITHIWATEIDLVTLAICLGVVVGHARAADTDPEGRLYQPSLNPVANVQRALDRAEDGDRLALVVLGI